MTDDVEGLIRPRLIGDCEGEGELTPEQWWLLARAFDGAVSVPDGVVVAELAREASASQRLRELLGPGGVPAEGGVPGDDSSLDTATFSSGAVWCVNVYPEAGELTVIARAEGRRPKECAEGHDWCTQRMVGGEPCPHRVEKEPDAQRSEESAANRATVKIRRYAAANRLDRLITLTYRGEGQHDIRQVRSDFEQFIKRLHRALKGRLPYVHVPELHPGGHGYHVHMLVGRFIDQRLIERTWSHGIVDVRKIQSNGRGGRESARRAAVYVAKYVAKSFTDPQVPKGSKRYDVARGFPPARHTFVALSEWGGIGAASSQHFDGEAPMHVFSSDDYGPEWPGPPMRIAVWP